MTALRPDVKFVVEESGEIYKIAHLINECAFFVRAQLHIRTTE